MCSCNNNQKCPGITVSLLSGYQSKYQCVQNNNLYQQVGMSEDYVSHKISFLQQLIASKQGDQNSCAALTYISIFDADMVKINATNVC